MNILTHPQTKVKNSSDGITPAIISDSDVMLGPIKEARATTLGGKSGARPVTAETSCVLIIAQPAPGRKIAVSAEHEKRRTWRWQPR